MSPTPPTDREKATAELADTFTGPDTSLVDLVDSLLDKGVVVDGEVVLGLAGIDLIYLRLAALLAAADEVIENSGTPRRRPRRTPLHRTGQPDLARAAGNVRAADQDEPDQGVGRNVSSADREEPATDHPLTLTDIPEPDRGRAGSPNPPPSAERPPLSVRAAPPESVASPVAGAAPVSRWNPDPDEVRKGVTRLVLALAEFIKQLLERRAVRRMEAGTLSDVEVERLGTALAHLEETLRDMAERAGLDPAEVNLDLGPLGKLV